MEHIHPPANGEIRCVPHPVPAGEKFTDDLPHAAAMRNMKYPFPSFALHKSIPLPPLGYPGDGFHGPVGGERAPAGDAGSRGWEWKPRGGVREQALFGFAGRGRLFGRSHQRQQVYFARHSCVHAQTARLLVLEAFFCVRLLVPL